MPAKRDHGASVGDDELYEKVREQGYPTVRLASAKGFRVLESRLETSGAD